MLAYNQNAAPPLTISVFVMQGCPACEDFKPRVRRIYAELQQQGHQMPPLAFVDANASNAQEAANFYKIQFTPTTVIQRAAGGWVKWEVALPDEQIRWVLAQAARGAQAQF